MGVKLGRRSNLEFHRVVEAMEVDDKIKFPVPGPGMAHYYQILLNREYETRVYRSFSFKHPYTNERFLYIWRVF